MAVEPQAAEQPAPSGDAPRPVSLWKALSDEQRVAAASAFWTDTESAALHRDAVALIAGRLNFRPKSVVALPLERRARALASIKSLPDSLALRALVSYHLVHQRPMMAAFLDKLGIAHEEGLIKAEEMTAPPPDRLLAAAAELTGQHPAEDVRLYLSTLVAQDPETWGGLASYLLSPAS